MATLTATAASDIFRREPDSYIDLGFGQAAYRKVGTGPDVLFVHGWPVSGATFRHLLPYLVEHVTCHIIDLPGAGSSRFDDGSALSFATHVASVRGVLDHLDLDSVSVVGHDSGGMITRHAVAGDPRVRSIGLINTEQPQGLSARFKMFLVMRKLPKFGAIFGWICRKPALRRNKFVLGDAFVESSSIDGEFDEFFLKPLAQNAALMEATISVLNSLSEKDHILTLGAIHEKIDVPVKLVWGAEDPFFPVERAREMVDTFPNATLDVIPGAGLFCHEEHPAEVAAALLPALVP